MSANSNVQRGSLVRAIRDLQVHDHICSIYASTDEKIASIVPFVSEGLARNEKCVYVADENTIGDITEILKREIDCLDHYLKNGSLIITDKKETYLKQGSFNIQWMLDFLTEQVRQAKLEGFNALRICGEATWILGDEPLIKEFIEYESKVNGVIDKYNISALCLYNKNLFDPEILKLVILSHPLIIHQKTVCRNYHYIPTEELTKKNYRLNEADRMLEQIVLTEEYINSLKEKNSELESINKQLSDEILARKKAETELNLQQKLLKDVLELVPVGVWVIDKDGNRIVGNKMVRTIWEGLKYDERKDLEFYKGWWAETGEQIKPEEWASVRATAKGEISLSEEIIIQCFDGSKKTILNSAVPIIKDGQTTGAIIVNVDITELKQAQEKNALNARLFDMTNDAIFSIDENLTITTWNKGAEKVYEWTSGEVIGKNTDEILHSQISFDHRTKLMRDIQNGKNEVFEIKQFTKSGKEIIVEISSLPLFDNYGKHIGFLNVNRDITERKKAEESLRLYQRRLQLAADHFNFNFCIYDAEGKFQYANPHFLERVKRNIKEVIGKKDQDLFSDDVVQQYLPVIYKTIETKEPQSVEIEYNFDTDRRNVVIDYIPIIDENNKVFQIVATGYDISELRRTENQLRFSEELYRATFEQAAVGIAQVDLEGKFIKANKKLSSILGYSKPELQSLTFQDITYKEDLSLDLDYAGRLLAGEIQTYQMEKRYVRKDNLLIWANLTAAIVRDEFGNPLYFIAVVEDIDSKKKSEQMLQSTLEELKRSNRDLAQFAYVASHDLQEPLRMISSYLSLLSRRYGEKFDSTAQTYMGFAVEGAKRMSDLINDLLTYSRLSAKTAPRELIDIREIMSEVIKELSLLIDESNAEIDCGTLPVVLADKFQMKQLFLNLLANSIKFRKDISPVIKINAEMKDNEWIFSIRDNGIGIEQEYFEKIFVIFQRLHTRDKYPGTGIGLTICKKIVEQHHGRIWVESEVDKGSTFYFTVPADF